MNKQTLNFIWSVKKTKNGQHNIEGEEQFGGLTLSYFKTYYKTTVIKKMWYQRNGQIDQWNKIETLDIDWHKYSQLISDKGAQTRQYSKNSLFNK